MWNGKRKRSNTKKILLSILALVSASALAGVVPTSPTWGAIGGSIASQSDLQTLFNTKQNNLTLTTTGADASLVGATFNRVD